MNIMVIGSGAREQAIAHALHRSKQSPQLFAYGTSNNPGIKQMTIDFVAGDITDVTAVVAKAKAWHIDLAVIGPEAPLECGLADALWAATIPTVGPKMNLAQIETSKVYARNLMRKHKIAGLPKYQYFTDLEGVEKFLKQLGEDNYVIKANGLMAGKGVKVSGEHLHSITDAIDFCQYILSEGQTFIVEEKLAGQEFSLMCFCDGHTLHPMPLVQDHKRALVGDEGPNTGGMGSYSDANHLLPFLYKHEMKTALEINKAVVNALMKEEKDRYVGIFYGSFIVTKKGVYVIEFNCRLGDPEAMNVLALLDSDFVNICQAMVTGNLKKTDINFAKKATVCKYAVPKGYPDDSIRNAPINIAAVKNKANLYLSAVNAKGGKLIALGSRTAAYVGVASSISQAEKIAEKEISAISGPLYHREDIGTEALIQKRMDAMRKLRAKT